MSLGFSGQTSFAVIACTCRFFQLCAHQEAAWHCRLFLVRRRMQKCMVIIVNKAYKKSDRTNSIHQAHHNQLLLMEFDKNLEPMMSKAQPAADYWTNDDKITSKVQPAVDYWTVDQENMGTRWCYFWWVEKQRAGWQNSFKDGEIFWMKNKAIIEFGFRRLWRILQISEGAIHLDLQNSSYPKKAEVNNF